MANVKKLLQSLFMKETHSDCNKTAVFLLLRLFLGVLFVIAFIGKLKGETNGYSLANLTAFSQGTLENFSKNTFLPRLLLAPYCYALPWLELILGTVLLLGIKTRLTLIAYGLIMISLWFGMLLLKQHSVAAGNSFYFFLVLVALYFAPYNRFALTRE